MHKVNFRKNFKHDFFALCTIAVLFSFVGFFIENLYKLIDTGIMDNLGFITFW